MPQAIQAALLRLLDDWTVRPVGGRTCRRVDVQLVAATNVDLEAAVAEGRFRADLYYRLEAVEVTLPPLRERADLDALIAHLLARIDSDLAVAPTANDLLHDQTWPGNVRELTNLLNRAALVSDQPLITRDTLLALGLGPSSGRRRGSTAIAARHEGRDRGRGGRGAARQCRGSGTPARRLSQHGLPSTPPRPAAPSAGAGLGARLVVASTDRTRISAIPRGGSASTPDPRKLVCKMHLGYCHAVTPALCSRVVISRSPAVPTCSLRPAHRSSRIGDPRLAARLADAIEGEVRFGAFDRGRYATDASLYQIEPLGVIRPRHKTDIEAAVAIVREAGVSLLARGGGTSQAGQTVGRSVVVDTSRWLTGMAELHLEAETVWVEPGLVLDELNRALRPHGLFYPVDVSTSSRATLGGMTANNSCGSRSLHYGVSVDNVLAIEAVTADGQTMVFGNEAGLPRPSSTQLALEARLRAIAAAMAISRPKKAASRIRTSRSEPEDVTAPHSRATADECPAPPTLVAIARPLRGRGPNGR